MWNLLLFQVSSKQMLFGHTAPVTCLAKARDFEKRPYVVSATENGSVAVYFPPHPLLFLSVQHCPSFQAGAFGLKDLQSQQEPLIGHPPPKPWERAPSPWEGGTSWSFGATAKKLGST